MHMHKKKKKKTVNRELWNNSKRRQNEAKVLTFQLSIDNIVQNVKYDTKLLIISCQKTQDKSFKILQRNGIR